MKLEKKIEVGRELQKLTKTGHIEKAAGINSGVSGAALTTPDLNREILSPDFLEGTLYDKCSHVPVASGHNSIVVPKALQASRTISSGILGGLAMNVSAEEAVITNSAPQFTQDTLVLNKQAIVVRVTDEILSDAAYLSKWLHDKFEEAFRFNTDYMILYGNAVGNVTTAEGTTVYPTCNGILNSGNRATYFVTVASPLALADLRAMVKHYYGNPKGVWAMNQYTWNQVVDLVNAANAYQAIKWHKKSGADELIPYLFGFEVVRKDNMEQGDIVLGDFSQYSVAEINPRTEASSEVYFSSFETAFRMLYRVNGDVNWSTGITLEDGNVVYPFVACAHANQNPEGANSISQGFQMVVPKANK